MKTIHNCKIHGKPYTVCPICKGEYCEITWRTCPRADWKPEHGATDAEVGRRYKALQDARAESERRLAAR